MKINKFVVILVISFFVWNLLTSYFGSNFERSLDGIFWRWQGLIAQLHYLLLVLIVLITRPKVGNLGKTLVLAASVEALYLFWLILAKALWDIPIYLYAGRAVGTFGNPDYLAGFLAICLPLCFLFKNKIISFLTFSLILAGIILSGSRGAVLAIFLGAVIIGVILFHRQNFKKLFPTFIALAIFCLTTAIILVKRDINPLNYAEGRERIYGRGFQAVLRQPIMGYGLENFELAIANINYREKIRSQYELRIDKAHNETLEILVASGIIGLIIWVAIVFSSVSKLVSGKHYILLAALLIYLIKAQTNVVSFFEYLLFWLIIGLAFSKRSPHSSFSERDRR